MTTTKIIIQARTGSTRLPNKILLPFYENQTILDLLIANLKMHFDTRTIVLATSTSANDQKLKKVAQNHQINFFQGDEDNVLQRFIDCAHEYNADSIVRICADNPFLMPEYIPQLLAEIKNGKMYASYQWPDKTPVMLSHIGLFAEAFTIEFLLTINKLTSEKLYQEHVTNFLYPNKEKFDAVFLPIPSVLHGLSNVRLTIDTENDFSIAQEIYKDWRTGEKQNLNTLLNLIKEKPLLLNRMIEEINRNVK